MAKITILTSLTVALFGVALTTSCNKATDNPNPTSVAHNPAAMTRTTSTPITSICNTTTPPYNITLMSVVQDPTTGYYVWTWKLQNPNPGNGNNNTVQDLSHWDIKFGDCVGDNALTMNDIVSAEFSGDGTNWTSFSAGISTDPSIKSFSTGPVLKFPLGSNGSNYSYYRLTLKRDFEIDNCATSYYKSGVRTGEGIIYYPGVGCFDSGGAVIN